MFRVTLLRFDPATGRASAELGDRNVGELRAAELIALLVQLRAVDPIENVGAEPEIIVETRRQKHVVSTNLGRLYLAEPRNVLEPALVLSPEEIVAELDGSAAAARNRALAARTTDAVVTPVAAPKAAEPARPSRPAPRRIALGASALCLATYIACAQPLFRSEPPEVEFEAIADARQIQAYRTDVAGVYMTGSQPGHHGIALAEDGTMKLFQLNVHGTPSLLRDTFRVGRVNGQFSVSGTQPGGPMQFTGKTTLTYCGETYQRLR